LKNGAERNDELEEKVGRRMFAISDLMAHIIVFILLDLKFNFFYFIIFSY